MGSIIKPFPIIDEDDMSSDSATKVPTQQSVKAYVDDNAGGGGGQTLYTHVVAASGGDYTTLGAAIAAASNGDSIFIRNGTYSESTISSALTDLTIIGESRDQTVIDMTSNNCTFSGQDLTLRNITFDTDDSGITISGASPNMDNIRIIAATNTNRALTLQGDDAVVSGLILVDSGTSGTIYPFWADSNRACFTGCNFTLQGKNTNGAILVGDQYSTWTGCTFQHTGTGTSGSLLYVNSGQTSVIGCTFIGNDSYATGGINLNQAYNRVIGCNFVTIGGAAIFGAPSNNLIEGNWIDAVGDGIDIGVGQQNRIVNNHIQDATIGIDIDGDENVISGNYMAGCDAAGLDIASGADHNIVDSNYFNNETITDASDFTIYNNNQSLNTAGDSVLFAGDRKITYCQNTSGGTITVGMIVTVKAAAAGNEVNTSTSAGDDLVYGMMLTSSVSNNGFGYILTEGYTTKLKADGTDDIAIGDFLSQSTTAGIVKKAAAGETAIAIALEAYTSDDTSGVLNAKIISPRKVGTVV